MLSIFGMLPSCDDRDIDEDSIESFEGLRKGASL